jgi:hypothetical protein
LFLAILAKSAGLGTRRASCSSNPPSGTNLTDLQALVGCFQQAFPLFGKDLGKKSLSYYQSQAVWCKCTRSITPHFGCQRTGRIESPARTKRWRAQRPVIYLGVRLVDGRERFGKELKILRLQLSRSESTSRIILVHAHNPLSWIGGSNPASAKWASAQQCAGRSLVKVGGT